MAPHGHTVTITVERLDADRARLRYDYGPGCAPADATVPVPTIADLLRRAETDYCAALPADPVEARALLESYGTRLFTFLDTPERRLAGHLDRTRGSWDVLVLALRTGAGFAHLPWELLHDGGSPVPTLVEEMRAELLAENDWTLPPVNFQDMDMLPAGTCEISVRGETVHSANLTADPDPLTRALADLRAVAVRHRRRTSTTFRWTRSSLLWAARSRPYQSRKSRA